MSAPFTPDHFYPLEEHSVSSGPDFIGIGAPKSGTTWWYHLLQQHPQVVHNRLRTKELAYFYHFATKGPSQAQIEVYHRAFDCPSSKISGEWSPSYLFYPCALEFLAQTVPNKTKILLLLRNPIDRFHSHLNQFRRTHSDQANGQTVKSLVDKFWGIPDAGGHSLYALGLAKSINYFGRDNILVLQYERCVQEPDLEFTRTCRFLGIKELDKNPAFDTPKNPSTYAIPPLPPAERRILARYFEHDVRSVIQQLQDIDISLWPDFQE